MLFFWLLGTALADPTLLDKYTSPATTSSAAAPDASPFLWKVEPLELAPGKSGTLRVQLVVPPGTHVYRDQVEVAVAEAKGLKVGPPSLPPGLHKADPADPSTGHREQYDLDVIVEIPVTAPKSAAAGVVPVKLDLRVQGCRPGLCFPPQTETMDAFVRVTPPAGSATTGATDGGR
jgi:hypothetical protein